MPVITKCPLCGFNGNHGFNIDAGLYIGTAYYHGGCRYIIGNDGKTYKTLLAAFVAQCPKSEQATNWGRMRIAQLSGHERIADKYRKLWQAESDNDFTCK